MPINILSLKPSLAAKLDTISADFTATDLAKELQSLGEHIDDTLNLLNRTKSELSAALTLEVDLATPKSSPRLDKLKPESVGVESLTKLRKNFKILNELNESLILIESLEARIQVGIRKSTGISTEKALTSINQLKKKVKTGVQTALDTLTNLSKAKHPKALAKFTAIVSEALSKSVEYSEIRLKSFVFEADGVLCYTDYIRVQSVVDEKQRTFPEMFIALTYKIGATPEVFVSVFKRFQIPSEEILTRKVSSVSETLRSISMLMELEGVHNSLNTLPTALVLKKNMGITKDLFSYENYISTVVVDDHAITFNLKTSVKDRSTVDQISTKIFRELNSIIRKTNAKLRMSVQMVGRSYSLSFFFVSANDSPLVEMSDVDFMRDRFNLSDDTLSKIVNVMNVGV